MNRKQQYNTGKAIDRDELDLLIEDAKDNSDWSMVELANVSEIVDMSNLFRDIKGIENLNLDGWDTSHVEGMGAMFLNSNYNHPLNFDTSKVKDMAYIFSNSNYNHPLDFDTSHVEDMCAMFSNSKYNHPLDFDTSKVKDMAYMFSNSNYNHPLDFDTSKVENMDDIFYNTSIISPITFKGDKVPDDVHVFINETNTTYEEKIKIKEAIQSNNVIAQPLKL